jgi:adenine-specific DNA-methyltransferase
MPKPKTRPTKTTPVESVTHKDKRANIPTEELRDFVADDEKRPKTVLYPRDPSLDPQLVWKGKDEQDASDLAVPAVPVYIQEKIQPRAIIENVRAHHPSPAGGRAGAQAGGEQLALFADFNGIEFEDLIDFYRHEQNWANRMILGDSLLVMTSLAEKEGLKGQVQMIYLDPPYGIKFGSNWQVSTRRRDVKDGKAQDATRQPEQIKAFRDTWELGIHSYLAYLRDRLAVARELLTESGSVFVQIGEENVHLVRCLLDEVFGAENMVSQITYRTKNMTFGAKYLETIADFILWYAKDKERLKYRQLYRDMVTEGDGHWNLMEFADGRREQMTGEQIDNHKLLPEGVGDVCQLGSLYPAGVNESGLFSFAFRGKEYTPPPSKSWKTNQTGMQRVIFSERLEPYQGGQTVRYVMKARDYPISSLPSLWHDTPPPVGKNYVVETSDKVIQRCVLMATDPGDLVLDPTCGSGTTAYVAEQWGRRWITIDTSRVAIALAGTRLMSARFPYYILADSPEGSKLEAELTGLAVHAFSSPRPVGEGLRERGDIKRGFVYKRVPHITLKSIANNDEIDAIHAVYQAQLEPLRARINKLAKQKWEEWQAPREIEEGSNDLKSLLQEYWRLRRERQKEIDDSIARHADTELLYDQPYEDSKRIRVTGPFTVESLSPHRVLATEVATTGARSDDFSRVPQFETMIVENLKKAGVQNTIKKERLKFDRLEPFAGTWLHAAGEYTEATPSPARGGGPGVGATKRVAVSIGPEHGTVGPEQVKEAAKEAVQGVGFDLLIVCGFAFDPHVSEEAKRYGKLTVLTARMNPDLAMGDELLKKTGAGNLFMVFGEPDLVIHHVKEKTRSDDSSRSRTAAKAATTSNEKLVVEVKGVDVYDPTTGQIRSSSTDDIACWFIDTDYNGESFFVRHAYFTGAGDPYERLKRALRAEIDEAAWSALYSTKSYPFDPPRSGKIAVKVINHYGDEVLKVHQVGMGKDSRHPA